MTNIERMKVDGTESTKIFAETLENLSAKQGFYTGLYEYINKMNHNIFARFMTVIEAENFKDAVDVILWLEDDDV